MNTVTSAVKKKIESQMKTAFPFVNKEIDFNIDINGEISSRTNLILDNNDVKYKLPIFYLTPSTDASVWNHLIKEICQYKNSQGILFIRFKDDSYIVNNATTYALSMSEMNKKHLFQDPESFFRNEMFCSYPIELFNVDQMNNLFGRIQASEVDRLNQPEDTFVEKSDKKAEALEQVEQVEEVKQVIEVKEENPVSQAKSNKKQETDLDDDIRTLINQCFGL